MTALRLALPAIKHWWRRPLPSSVTARLNAPPCTTRGRKLGKNLRSHDRLCEVDAARLVADPA
eukprot:CAMPEP_0115503814 /NCGR_PEP_ID=MMETSP0271-20121206/69680_1 /TAXON_ID=71861 /ORGANISM="Scrippsiella trochoidea, Strain CCMP3099" /LENGTH=62 /DNA_ID=CAMNT_0002932937 /DNA_START=25 /DNA_END=211 /DNA_ORIENTATION=-